jgi:hypothetical protein
VTELEDTTTGQKVTNDYTPAGKLKSVTTNTSSHQLTWDGAGRTRTTLSKPGGGAPDSMSEAKYDDTGRMLENHFGEASGGAITRDYDSTIWNYGGSDLPSSITSHENNNANTFTQELTNDAFGRATRVTTPGATDMTVEQHFDSIGNVTKATTPAMRGELGYAYDARGLMTDETKPAAGGPPAVNKRDYDGSGVLTQYTDALGQPTKTENDGLVASPFPFGWVTVLTRRRLRRCLAQCAMWRTRIAVRRRFRRSWWVFSSPSRQQSGVSRSVRGDTAARIRLASDEVADLSREIAEI